MQELEKILKKIERYIKIYQMPPLGREAEGTVELLEECRNIIRKQINAGWIPVEERLPTRGECEKDNNEFFVQTNTGERFSCEYDPLANGFDNPLWCCNVPVVAWRPLPEPYRPERIMK